METDTGGAPSRILALRILLDYQQRDVFVGSLLSSALEGSGLDRRDKALVTGLVQGTVRMKLTLDWVLKQFSNRPLESLDPGVIWALRLSAFQLMFMSVPGYAAVDMAATPLFAARVAKPRPSTTVLARVTLMVSLRL